MAWYDSARFDIVESFEGSAADEWMDRVDFRFCSSLWAAGAGSGAKRFLFVVEGNGLPWQQITLPEIKGKPMPTTCHPMTAYGDLFGSVAGGAAKVEFQARTDVLDFLTDDLKRLRTNVGGAEKDKLDAHVGAYENLRQRQSRLNEIENTLRKSAPTFGDKYKSAVETDRLDAHFDLAAAALIGGLTNVATIASGVGDPYFSVAFRGLGVDVGKHTLGYGGNSGVMTWDQAEIVIRRFTSN